jgi:hypothetical protein
MIMIDDHRNSSILSVVRKSLEVPVPINQPTKQQLVQLLQLYVL